MQGQSVIVMTEHESVVEILREALAVHDRAAIRHMRDAQEHLRKARELSMRIERLERDPREKLEALCRAGASHD